MKVHPADFPAKTRCWCQNPRQKQPLPHTTCASSSHWSLKPPGSWADSQHHPGRSTVEPHKLHADQTASLREHQVRHGISIRYDTIIYYPLLFVYSILKKYWYNICINICINQLSSPTIQLLGVTVAMLTSSSSIPYQTWCKGIPCGERWDPSSLALYFSKKNKTPNSKKDL